MKNNYFSLIITLFLLNFLISCGVRHDPNSTNLPKVTEDGNLEIPPPSENGENGQSGIPTEEDPLLQPVVFNDVYTKVFVQKCTPCHLNGGNSGGVVLDTYKDVTEPKSKKVIVEPGSAKDSLLWKAVETDFMPSNADPLTDQEKALIKKWIDDGALN